MVQKLSLDQYKSIYSTVPRMCVDVVIRHNGGIVLSKRLTPPSAGMWHIPGGTILMGESLREAVVRVAKEETGLDVKIVNPAFMVVEYSSESGFGQPVSIAYLTESVAGELKVDEHASEIGVFRDIPDNIIKEQKQILAEVMK